MCENPTQAATILTGKLSDILDTLAPVKTFQVRKKYAAWLSDNTKDLIKLRNEAQAKAYQNNEQDYWREYKNLRNRVTAKLRSDKKEWEKNKLDGAKHNATLTTRLMVANGIFISKLCYLIQVWAMVHSYRETVKGVQVAQL